MIGSNKAKVLREPHWKRISELGKDFVRRLLSKTPTDRLSAAEVGTRR